MLRQGPGMVPQSMNQPGMFQTTINTPHLISQQSPGQQPQAQGSPMGLLPNHANAAQAMGLLGGAQSNGNMSMPNYSLQMQQAVNQQRRTHTGNQGMGQGMMVPGQGGINGMMQNVNFAPQLIPQRRSQPQNLAQVSAHQGGMHNVPQGLVTGPMGLPGMNPQYRAVGRGVPMTQQQQAQLTGGQAGLQPDMQMLRQGIPNGGGFNSLQRSASQPHSMATLQGSSMTPFPQLPMQQQFQNSPMQQPHQPQPPQLATSPHPPHNHQPPPGLVGQGGQMGYTRRLTPEQQNILMNLQQNAQLQPNMQQRMASGSGGPFQFTASTPPNQLGDVPPSLPNGIMRTPVPQSRLITPAQTLEMTQGGGGEGVFSMPPPQQPPRPPSQQRPHTGFQMVPPSVGQPSPRQLGRELHGVRPQSQPQAQQGSPRQRSVSRTPRLTQQQIAPHAGSQPRIPAVPSQQPNPTGPKPPTPALAGNGPMAGGRQPSIQRTPVLRAATPSGPPTPVASQPAPNGPAPIPGPALPEPPMQLLPQQPLQYSQQMPPHLAAGGHSIPMVLQAKANQIMNANPFGLNQSFPFIMGMSAQLAAYDENKQQLSWWNKFAEKYFVSQAIMKITLWKDNRREEAKPFEIGTPIIPRFFLVTTQSGVQSMSITLDNARERILTHERVILDSRNATWTFKYSNGYVVMLRGPFTAQIVVLKTPLPPGSPPNSFPTHDYKIEHLNFDANIHEKYLSVHAIEGQRLPDSPQAGWTVTTPQLNGEHEDGRYEEPRCSIEHASIPAEPVNAFGIPQATMRCLELAESVSQMSDLIQFSTENASDSPIESLRIYAQKLRSEVAFDGPPNGFTGGPDGQGLPMNGPTAGSSSALYGNMPAASIINNRQPQPSQPQNVPPTGTPKVGKALPPGQAQASASASTPGPTSASTPASAPTPTASTSTPAMQPASLKRKATTQDPPQPPAGTSGGSGDQPPAPKRPARKRGRTGGG